MKEGTEFIWLALQIIPLILVTVEVKKDFWQFREDVYNGKSWDRYQNPYVVIGLGLAAAISLVWWWYWFVYLVYSLSLWAMVDKKLHEYWRDYLEEWNTTQQYELFQELSARSYHNAKIALLFAVISLFIIGVIYLAGGYGSWGV